MVGSEPDAVPPDGAQTDDRRAPDRGGEAAEPTLMGLAAASLAMSDARGVAAVLRVATERARLLVGAHQAMASLTVGEGGAQGPATVSLSDAYATDRDDETPAGPAGMQALVCRENRPYRLTQGELEAHPAWRDPGPGAAGRPPMRGWLAVPLVARDGSNLGLLEVSDRYEGEFDEDDEAILVQLALLASAGVENARLLDEAREALAALARSEQRFRTLVSATSEIVWTTDGRGHFLEPSASWERYTGQSPAQYMGEERGWIAAVHPDDRPGMAQAWSALLPRGERVDMEFRLRRADGAYRRMAAAAIPVREGDGTVREWVGSTSDVEDLRRAEEAYREQTGLTRTITENAASALFLIDAAGHPTYMNAAAEAMTGFRLEEIRDRPLHDSVHHSRPDGRPLPIEECPIGQALERRLGVDHFEEVFVRSDGVFFPVRVAASPIIRDGETAGTVLEVQDITEERRARAQIEKFAALVETSTDFVGMTDLDGNGVYLNPAGRALVGLDPGAVGDVRLADLVDPETASHLRWRIIPRAMREGAVRGEWTLRHRETGERIPVEGVVLLVRDTATGAPLAIATVQRDIRERRRREAERAELLRGERVARRLAELLARTAAALAAAVTVPDVAGATIEGLQAAGVGIAAVHMVRDGVVEAFVREGARARARRPHGLQEDTPAAEAIRTGRPVEVTTAAEIEARYPRVARARRADGIESVMAVPLAAADGRVIGALVVGTAAPGPYPPEVRRMIGGVAEQCGLALERALLQAQAEAAAEDASLLSALGDALERPTTAAERCRHLVGTLAERTTLAAVHLLGDGGVARLEALAGRARSVAEGDALHERVERTLAAGDATLAGDEGGGEDLHVLPLRARGHTLGALTVAALPARPGTRGISGALAREIAARAAVAIDNALLYDRERHVSHTLQLGLLGGELPDLPGMAIAAAYHPGTVLLEVGGDWYDAFPLPGGGLGLVVGDVVGHGLEAALAMGQLRGAVRALAAAHGPAALLAQLDEVVATMAGADMTTIAYVAIDPATGAMRYACAGHPPPLLVAADGAPRLLWEGRSAPLGAAPPGSRTETGDVLGDGETLVLYTDGLVERRRATIDAGLARLMLAADRGPRVPRALVDHLCRVMLEGDRQDDDVCVLALRRGGPGLVYTFPAAPEQLAGMRARLRAWLAESGAGEDDRQAVLLAVGEAAANAVEHAYAKDGRGPVTLEARVEGPDLHLSVADAGGWRPPRREPDRGRGMGLMRALMDDVDVAAGGTGTVVRMRRRRREG